MNNQDLKNKRRERRKFHIRKRISGNPEKLRLTVFKSLNNIYAQIIDDVESKTLVSASTLDKDVKALIKANTKKSDQCRFVGEAIAKKAAEKNISVVAFDRNGYLYHGRVKALAEGARKSGLKF